MDQGPICPAERVNYQIFTNTSAGLDRYAIHPKLKSNDLGKSEDNYFYLSATEEKLVANVNSNGSFFAHQHANKKKVTKNASYRRF